jgi:hypothetical protein
VAFLKNRAIQLGISSDKIDTLMDFITAHFDTAEKLTKNK